VNLDNVSRDDWIVAGIALLLAIDLLFFPWFHVSASFGGITVSADSSGTGSPDGWLGVLAVLASLAVIADMAIERLSPQTTIPAISGSRAMTRFVLAAIAAFFMALKFLFHIHFSYFGWGFYLGVVLVIALVYFTLQARQAPQMAGARAGGSAGAGMAPGGAGAAGAAAAPPGPGYGQAPPAQTPGQAPPAQVPGQAPPAPGPGQAPPPPPAATPSAPPPASDAPVADPQATRISRRPDPEE
jgi:hypothetical protein